MINANSKYIIIWGISVFISLILITQASADTLVLQGGKQVTGIIKSQDEEMVEIEIYLKGGIITIKYPAYAVQEVIIDEEENADIRAEHNEKAREIQMQHLL